MRTKILTLGLAAISLLTVSCKKESSMTPATTGKATVSIEIKSSTPMRAYGTLSEEDKITKLTAIVYKGDAQEAIKEGDAGALEVKDIACTAGNRTLVVLANVPSDWDLKGVSKTKLEAMTFELRASNQTPEDLLMTSEFTTVTLEAGENYYGYDAGQVTGHKIAEGKPLEIKRIHAGIAFTSVTREFKPAYSAYSVKFDGGAIFALVAKKQSKIFGTPLANSDAAYLFGEAVPNGQYTPSTYTEEATLKTTVSDTDITDKSMTAKGFYVLENTSTKYPTILCLKGTLLQKNGSPLSSEQKKAAFAAGWIKSADDATTYYPVRVNAESNNYSYTGVTVERGKIVRNHKYEITLNITGPGTNKPEDPQEEKANLNVNCKIVPWVVVNQTANW